MKKLCRLTQVAGLVLLALVTGTVLQDLAGETISDASEQVPGAEDQLRKLKIELPPITKPTNTYVSVVQVGDLLFVSGTIPLGSNGTPITGRLGQDFDVREGQKAARTVGLQILSAVKHELGTLNKIQRLVKTLGMVHATADFKQHPQVVNGFSDLMVEIFGEEAGKGTRSAVGMSSLPAGVPVEIEVIFQVRK